MAIVQISLCSGNAVTRTRSITTSAAAFVAADMNAVTDVGAPWYTSGVHMWKGAAETLNAKPGEDHREPGDEERVVRRLVRPRSAEKPSSPVAP